MKGDDDKDGSWVLIRSGLEDGKPSCLGSGKETAVVDLTETLDKVLSSVHTNHIFRVLWKGMPKLFDVQWTEEFVA